MDHKVKKIALRRFIWLVCLLIISFSFALVVFIGKTKYSLIKRNITVLSNENTTYEKLDACISILYVAENNIRLYTVTSDSTYLTKFKQGIETVSSIIMDFMAQESEKKSVMHTDVNQLIKEKKYKNSQYAYLKKLTDSLLILSTRNIDSAKPALIIKYPRLKVTEKIREIDTVRVTQKRKGKKLFGRLADAIANKNDYVNQTNANSSSSRAIENADQQKEEIEAFNARALNKYYKQLLASNRQLNATEKELLLLNASIFSELQHALSKLKKDEIQTQVEYKNALISGTLENVQELDYLSVLSMGMVFALTVIILYNVYRLYQNDLALLKLSKQEIEYARMKGKFLATMSHEIRTPLNSVIGFAEQMDDSLLPENQKSNLEAIRASSGILLGIVNDILDFSKFESGKITLSNKPFQPYMISEEMLKMVSIPAQKKDIQLYHNFTFEPSLTVLGDAFRLKQVLMNLLSNAIKFTPVKGQVTLFSEILKKDDETVIWKFHVQDSGIGIAKENQAILFNEFQQIEQEDYREKSTGTGLGLVICKRIVELAGGKISVDSELGKGSVFTVSLPMALAKNELLMPNDEPVTKEIKEILAGKTVLIADDNSMNILLLSRILKKYDIDFKEASDGAEAFELFMNHNYDLIITDIQMPVMDGVTLVKKIRVLADINKSSVPVIAFSGLVSPEEQLKFKSAGMNGLLIKPFAEKDFKAILNEVLKD